MTASLMCSHDTAVEIWFVTGTWADVHRMAACVAPVIPEMFSFRFNFIETFVVYCATYWMVLKLVIVTAFCCWSLFQAPCTLSMHVNRMSNTYPIRLWVSWNRSLVLSADPQAYNVKSNSDSVPTIQIDLASPQSPDSVSAIDEFARANKEQQQQEEDQGLMMKPPAGARAPDKSGEGDVSREQHKLMRCLSDPGPNVDEEEDEPFLPWSSWSFDSGGGG